MDSLDELQLYVNLLEEHKNKKYSDYDLLIRDLKYEFNITTTFKQVKELYEPTAEEEGLDREILYRNIFE